MHRDLWQWVTHPCQWQSLLLVWVVTCAHEFVSHDILRQLLSFFWVWEWLDSWDLALVGIHFLQVLYIVSSPRVGMVAVLECSGLRSPAARSIDLNIHLVRQMLYQMIYMPSHLPMFFFFFNKSFTNWRNLRISEVILKKRQKLNI